MTDTGRRLVGVLLAIIALCAAVPSLAADYSIQTGDSDSNQGFYNPKSVDPVGGNEGKTLGAQRRIALKYALGIVLSRLASPVTVKIAADFDDSGGGELSCSKNMATLAYGGPTNLTYDFKGAPRKHTLYPIALANALAGHRLGGSSSTSDIQLLFNGRLDDGDASCLRGVDWYYGLDGDAGDDQLDFVATVVHEMIHGLGFITTVALTDQDNADKGEFPLLPNGQRYPDIYSTFVQDLAQKGQPRFPEMTVAQRADALDDAPYVVWSSSTTNNAAYEYLDKGLRQGRVRIFAPSPIQDGSSISHWSSALKPNQIMEPYESPDTGVLSGLGLSTCVLQDLGWKLANGTRCPDVASSAKKTDTGSGLGSMNGDSSSGGGGGGGGGGCTLDPRARFDPIWLAMLILAGGVLAWRRRRAMV